MEELTTRAMIFPGEDTAMYEGLREALFRNLAGRSPYEKLLADNLVTQARKAMRHRSMRDDLIRAQARDLAIEALSNSRAETVYRPTEEQIAFGHDLVGSDPERALAAAPP